MSVGSDDTPAAGASVTASARGGVSSGEGLALLAILTLALLAAIAPLAIDMYLAAFPTMADDLGTDPASIQLTLTTFMAGLAIGQLVIGPLSDRWGRRRPLLVGGLVCVLASALCAVAPNVGLLIVFRFVQGFAGAAGIVIGRAIVADTLKGAAAARIFSLLAIMSGLAPVTAPLLGGALLGPVGWRGVFGVLTGAAIVMLLGSSLVLRETLPPSRRHSGGVTATFQAARGVLSNRGYLGYLLAFVFSFGSMFSYISASPFVLQTAFGLSAGWYSVAFAANAFGLTSASLVSARLVGRVGPRRLLTIGVSTLFTADILLATLAATGSLAAWSVLTLLWLGVSSMGLIMGNAASLAVAQTPESAGTGAAVIGAGQFALAAVVSPLVGLGGEDTAVPMAVAMVVSATVAVLGLAMLTRRGPTSVATGGADVGEAGTGKGNSRKSGRRSRSQQRRSLRPLSAGD